MNMVTDVWQTDARVLNIGIMLIFGSHKSLTYRVLTDHYGGALRLSTTTGRVITEIQL